MYHMNYRIYNSLNKLAGLVLVSFATVLLFTAIPQALAQAQTPAGDPKSGQDAAIHTRIASCNCGQLRVTCKGPDPERISICQCNLCQKQSGSAFAIQARFPREQVTIEGKSTAWKFPSGKPVTYRNCASAGGTFHFCPVCGSTVYYLVDGDAARIGVKIGAFADPTFPPPIISGFEAYGHPWAMNVEALPMPGGHHE
jgi:hypothetical protein